MERMEGARPGSSTDPIAERVAKSADDVSTDPTAERVMSGSAAAVAGSMARPAERTAAAVSGGAPVSGVMVGATRERAAGWISAKPLSASSVSDFTVVGTIVEAPAARV